MTAIQVPNRRDFNAQDNANLAAQTFLVESLREASRKRDERAGYTAAALAAVAIAALVCAVNFAFPFLPH
jgi:hypothetical protein